MCVCAWKSCCRVKLLEQIPEGDEAVTPKAVPKAKAKGMKGKKDKQNPKATWDLRKAKLSTLDALPFPLVDRGATKELVRSIVIGKATVRVLLS